MPTQHEPGDNDVMTPAEIAEERQRLMAEAQAALLMTAAPKPTPVRVSTAAAPKKASTTNPNSIRQFLRNALLSGTDDAMIAAQLAAKFPTSQAAKKSPIHIAFYRSKLRQEGKLPKPVKVLTVSR